MQENEFEKQVRQKMGAFQLQPTGAVWQKLELAVAKGKERKRKYVIFSFLLVALLGSALLLNDLKQRTASTNEIAEKKGEKNLPQEKAGNNLQQQLQPKEKPPQAASFSANNHTDNKKQQQNLISLTNDKNSYHKIKRTTGGTVKIKVIPAIVAEDRLTVNDNVIADKEQSPITDMAVANKPRPAIKIIEQNGTAATTALNIPLAKKKEEPIKTIQQSPFTDIAVANKIKPAIKIIEQNDTVVTVALQQPPVQENKEPVKAIQTVPNKEKKKLWATSFSLAAGRSATDSKNLTDSSLAVNYDNTGVGSIPNGGVYYQPAATKPGFSFSAGFEISRALSAKTTLGTGLQYKLFTTSVATGERVNAPTASSNREDSFKSGSSNRYTSFYHFITIPISLSTQIATIKTREINLVAGINFSRLIHTNALQFDYVQGSYYRDNTIFNKTQVGLSAAFFINLAGKNKAPFYIGPDFYYSLTPQAASGMYTVSHIKSFGIQIKKVLQKNR